MLESFEAEYRRIYGMTIPGVAIEAVTWRLSAYAQESKVTPEVAAGSATGPPEPVSHRPAVFERGAEPLVVGVYRRQDLGVGATFAGPAIVEERETTTVVRAGWRAEVAPDGSLIATRGRV